MRYQPHSFHIPVMGTGFTIDTPLKVARYGISSVISLVDDVLIEQVHNSCGSLPLQFLASFHEFNPNIFWSLDEGNPGSWPNRTRFGRKLRSPAF